MDDTQHPYERGRDDGLAWKLYPAPKDAATVALKGLRKRREIDGRTWAGREYARGFLEVANAPKP